MNEARVAIVIVCMNNMKNLVTCLDSIAKYTKIEHEVWVNAYMFSDENLKIAQEKYPYVHWVINNEIAGFAENNNMILRQIKTEYVLVLNDDTEFKEPVLDELMKDIIKPGVDIVAPKMINKEGKVLWSGYGKPSTVRHLVTTSGLGRFFSKDKTYVRQKGFFRTYTICGACFLIKRELFMELGWFDEYYFFCPEDVALSDKAIKLGYNVWANADVVLYHYQGKSSSKVYAAVLPALRKGAVRFYGNGCVVREKFLAIIELLISLFKTIILLFMKDSSTLRKAQWNTVKTILSNKTPKEVFVHYYNRMLLAK